MRKYYSFEEYVKCEKALDSDCCVIDPENGADEDLYLIDPVTDFCIGGNSRLSVYYYGFCDDSEPTILADCSIDDFNNYLCANGLTHLLANV